MTELSCIIKDGGPARSKSHKLVIDSFNACGVNLEAVEILDDYMRKAGLVDISVQKFKLPLGDWGGNAGRLFAKNIQEAYATLIPLYASTSGISRKELEQLAEQVEVETKDYNAYEYLYVYTGRKP
ncbi:hypothetical protein THASP1DRAFT_31708 [Thamnocephalis sphaerospora]|uniref:Uncharacterized protein n=1 Tax=Thamnocephalis sphaerospora TaxID=78915 RepID=A0A4P9XL16_9FUNG|nr:hypothetical protein THASP1DRAFT_31708 [Thamnocephalis sphaerospora]|eukprot:RKP06475.1 hypothetical protein THASP1DRAFT_31708 [Thamnocephalis sphaerospora]